MTGFEPFFMENCVWTCVEENNFEVDLGVFSEFRLTTSIVVANYVGIKEMSEKDTAIIKSAINKIGIEQAKWNHCARRPVVVMVNVLMPLFSSTYKTSVLLSTGIVERTFS